MKNRLPMQLKYPLPSSKKVVLLWKRKNKFPYLFNHNGCHYLAAVVVKIFYLILMNSCVN